MVYCFGFLWILVAFFANPHRVHADCIEIVSGRVELETIACGAVESDSLFTSASQRAEFDRIAPPSKAKELLASYEGILLKGKVTAATAIAIGAKRRSKALLGKTIEAFAAGLSKKDCERFSGERIRGTIKETCCDGHWEVPCLTRTSYQFTPLR